MAKTGIFYGSTTGNTETVAEKIKELLDDADLIVIAEDTIDYMKDYENIILGTSTWGLGELQDDWELVIDKLPGIDLTGKKVAFFGTGDQIAYPDTFVNAMATLHEALKNSNATYIGAWPVDDYEHITSKSVRDGKFIGLAIDEDNQPEMTDERVQEWIKLIKPELQ